MKKWFLSSYFDKVAIKRLSLVEVDYTKSNQHEINWVKWLIEMFWRVWWEKRRMNTTFLYLWDDDWEYESVKDIITWYDSRYKNPNRTEYRLYYPNNAVTKKFVENDLLIIAQQPNKEVLFLAIEKGSNLENQILRLFESQNISEHFIVKDLVHQDKKIDFTTRFILEELWIQIKDIDENMLDTIISKFGRDKLPDTKTFSDFARKNTLNISPIEDPDFAIIAWMEKEEILFRTFERYLITEKLKKEKSSIFDSHWNIINVDNLFDLSISFQNRRKARVWQALENHLEQIFLTNWIKYSRWKKTEWNSKPDFIFPNIDYYQSQFCNKNLLTMLWSKSTCKDRWRQVLAEAKKIKEKHLFTLEPSISENQTNEMKKNFLQLIVPQDLFKTYKTDQQVWLLNLKQFINLVKEKEWYIHLNKQQT